MARVEKRNPLLSNWAIQRQKQQQEASQKAAELAADDGPASEICLCHDEAKEKTMDLAELGENQYPTKLYSPLRAEVDALAVDRREPGAGTAAPARRLGMAQARGVLVGVPRGGGNDHALI